MFSITANKLKRNGVAGIERVMQDNNETSILVYVRGKAKYVILSVDEFNQYREYQLDLAIAEAEAEACLANGDCSIIEDFENYAQVLERDYQWHLSLFGQTLMRSVKENFLKSILG
jgi:hypothetical protein